MSVVMADNENPNCIIHNAEEKMIWEAPQIHATKIALANGKGFGALTG